MKAIVTGGCGFIGSNLVDELISLGFSVEVIDDLSATSNEEFYYNDYAVYHKVDILDEKKVQEIFSNFLPDVVFHLAAKARIQTSIENPLLCCDVNFKGTANILEASRQSNVERVIFSSTSSIYGLKNECPLKEDMEKDCLNPYSVSKSGAEDLCKMYNNLYGLKTITFRYFNVYGERQPLQGEYAPVIGYFYRQKARGQAMTIVGDGLQTRDFTHVSDIVQANVLAAQTDNSWAFGEIFNVGTGVNHSVLDICTMIGGDYEHIPERLGEARETLADIWKIKTFLNYEPKIRLDDWIKEENLKYRNYV